MVDGYHKTSRNTSGAEIRENVTDEIFQITPESTPFYNSIGDTKTHSPLHGWQTRALAARSLNNQQIEGKVYAGNFQALNRPTRTSNLTQIFDKLPQVSRTRQSSEHIGIRDMMADQIAISAVELKNDMEVNLLMQTLQTGQTDTGRAMGSFFEIVTTNVHDYSSELTFDENNFNGLAEVIWAAGGNPSDVLVNSKLKRRISQFTDSATKYFFSEDKRVTNSINMYESDFGVVSVRLSHDMKNTYDDSALEDPQLYMYDRTFFKKAWLDTPFVQRLPVISDAVNAALTAELTLESGAQAAAGQMRAFRFHGLS